MRLEITITYADGKHQHVLRYYGLSPETAREKREEVLQKMQNCIDDHRIFCAGEGANMSGSGPEALANAHFVCNILED